MGALSKLLIVVGILLADVIILSVYGSLVVATVLAFITTFVLFHMTHGILRETALTGVAIGYLVAYHFYLQPVRPDLFPIIQGPLLWFFGVVIILRSTIFLGASFPVPGLREFALFMGAD